MKLVEMESVKNLEKISDSKNESIQIFDEEILHNFVLTTFSQAN